ncbi:MAG: zf-HC2 domain-containing protein [bacterium]|nr:zf-HC2 domain-containing protein [bacterium]
MRHREIEILIQKSLDHATNREEERILRLHLSGCPACRQFYQELVQTEQALAGLIEFYPRQDFDDRVLRKLGLVTSLVWAKAAMVLIGAWFGSTLFLVFSPLTKGLFNRVLTSIPALVRLLDKAQLVLSSFSHILKPFAKNLNYSFPIIAFMFAILLVYFFGRTIKKEVVCRS